MARPALSFRTGWGKWPDLQLAEQSVSFERLSRISWKLQLRLSGLSSGLCKVIGLLFIWSNCSCHQLLGNLWRKWLGEWASFSRESLGGKHWLCTTQKISFLINWPSQWEFMPVLQTYNCLFVDNSLKHLMQLRWPVLYEHSYGAIYMFRSAPDSRPILPVSTFH